MAQAGLAGCSRGSRSTAWSVGASPPPPRQPASQRRPGLPGEGRNTRAGAHVHKESRVPGLGWEGGTGAARAPCSQGAGVLWGRAGDRSLPGASSRGERVWSTFLGDSSVMDGRGAGTSGAHPDPWAPSRLGGRGPRAGLFLPAPASPGRAEHGVRLAQLGPTLSSERKCGWLPGPPRDSRGGLGWGSASRPEPFLPLQRLPGRPGGWAGRGGP